MSDNDICPDCGAENPERCKDCGKCLKCEVNQGSGYPGMCYGCFDAVDGD